MQSIKKRLDTAAVYFSQYLSACLEHPYFGVIALFTRIKENWVVLVHISVRTVLSCVASIEMPILHAIDICCLKPLLI